MKCGNCGFEMGDHGQYNPGDTSGGWGDVTRCQRCGFGDTDASSDRQHFARCVELLTDFACIYARAGSSDAINEAARSVEALHHAADKLARYGYCTDKWSDTRVK